MLSTSLIGLNIRQCHPTYQATNAHWLRPGGINNGENSGLVVQSVSEGDRSSLQAKLGVQLAPCIEAPSKATHDLASKNHGESVRSVRLARVNRIRQGPALAAI